jgi:cell division transport system permease protein
VKEVDMMKLKKMFDAEKFVKSTQFITKEEAAKTLSQDLGEDFLSFLGYNPLLSSIELRLKADYANPDSVKWIEAKLNMHPEVKEIFYQKSLVDFVNENVKKIGFIIIGFASILLIISIALINNTIRLAIYSKRFLIKTMQLVGATKGFIAGPFIRSGILQGITSSIIAIGLLSAVIYFAQTQIPDLKQLHGIQESIILFTSMIVLGILITGISTLFAVRKFLKLSHDELYK